MFKPFGTKKNWNFLQETPPELPERIILVKPHLFWMVGHHLSQESIYYLHSEIKIVSYWDHHHPHANMIFH
jgi:hypothetical protein